jgi:hypothetical protein
VTPEVTAEVTTLDSGIKLGVRILVFDKFEVEKKSKLSAIDIKKY